MICDIISPTGAPVTPEGHWEWQQDPDSGSVVQVWVDDDPSTDAVEGLVIKNVPLFAEGILDGGIRVAGTTERFTKEYENVDFVKAVFDKDVMISKRDRVTNIRNGKSGELIWREEEISGWPATTFNVMGVTPVLFLGKTIEKAVLLERAGVQ